MVENYHVFYTFSNLDVWHAIHVIRAGQGASVRLTLAPHTFAFTRHLTVRMFTALFYIITVECSLSSKCFLAT